MSAPGKRESKLCRAALAYAAKGWPVFPLAPGGKVPLLSAKQGGHGFLDATTDAAQIRAWWDKYPTANIGLPTGQSIGCVVFDADTPAAVERVRAALGTIATPTVETGRGAQFYFAVPPWPVKNRTAVGGNTGLDVRGDGGYVVAPPSIHPSGKPYRWLSKCGTPAPLPEALATLLQHQGRNGTGPTKSARIQATDRIRKGTRDDRLFRHGCYLREVFGWEEARIYDELARVNREQGDPPLDDDKVREKAANAAKYEPSADDRRLSDSGNARRLVRWFGDELRYVKLWAPDGWRVWDGRRWSVDDTGGVDRLAKQVIRRLYEQAAAQTDDTRRKLYAAHARASDSDHRLRSMLNLAATELELARRPEDFNRDPWLLNVLNGTLDLRTGALRPHAREDMLTALAPVTFDPEANCPRWLAFMDRVTGGDAALARYLQRVTGYTLTGDTGEQCFFMPNGPGANGKTTYLEALRQGLLGSDYAKDTPLSTFLVGREDVVRADIARLNGARLVTATETADGRRLDETLVKRLTGGDTMTARLLYHGHFEYVPQLKLFVSTNYRPEVRGTDEAIWRRVRVLPFTVNIPPAERDKHLVSKLVAEAPGLLNWALDGCRAWQAEGLAEPESVRHATAAYRHEQDLIGQFLKERCSLGPDCSVPAPELRREYETWCRDEAGTKPLAGQAFKRQLSERGITLQKRHAARVWVGVTVPL